MRERRVRAKKFLGCTDWNAFELKVSCNVSGASGAYRRVLTPVEHGVLCAWRACTTFIRSCMYTFTEYV